MFAKPPAPSIKIQKYMALEPRFPTHHPNWPIFQADYKNWLAGYKGEKSLEFHLSMLPDEDYHIFHNIRLPWGKYFFQIDYLLLCKTFALILEVKNRSGEYRFEKHLNQTTLSTNGRISNPVLQARLQALKLKKWLKKHHYPEIPIDHLFVNSNQKATIRIGHRNEQILRYICHSEGLLEKISQIQAIHKQEKLDSKELRKLKRLILSSHTPEIFDILAHYQLTSQDLLTGVACPVCGTLPMTYSHGSWSCSMCSHRSRTAHKSAIQDYFLLIKPTITNAELRQFLQVDSARSANRILSGLNLATTGPNKTRIYFLQKKNHCQP
ncbi:nuclease-related domain-containing protein [Neobacillus jeddahensis]|uniref:nuclease-related domain-containing protein n=1 Tax=Neobacillus jeddahensis TaxID=1461580 RepID=UPI0009E0369D|nr:nuclease-related domain-containing protein [Neobacillus jeddahensis]